MKEAVELKTSHEPKTLEKDGFEVVEYKPDPNISNGEKNGDPRFPNNAIRIHLGPSTTVIEFQRYLVYDPERAEAIDTSAQNPKTRQTLIDVLDQSGFIRYNDTNFEAHIVAARARPQKN